MNQYHGHGLHCLVSIFKSWWSITSCYYKWYHYNHWKVYSFLTESMNGWHSSYLFMKPVCNSPDSDQQPGDRCSSFDSFIRSCPRARSEANPAGNSHFQTLWNEWARTFRGSREWSPRWTSWDLHLCTSAIQDRIDIVRQLPPTSLFLWAILCSDNLLSQQSTYDQLAEPNGGRRWWEVLGRRDHLGLWPCGLVVAFAPVLLFTAFGGHGEARKEGGEPVYTLRPTHFAFMDLSTDAQGTEQETAFSLSALFSRSPLNLCLLLSLSSTDESGLALPFYRLNFT